MGRKLPTQTKSGVIDSPLAHGQMNIDDIWREKSLDPSQRLVLIMLARSSLNDGLGARLTMKDIADCLGLSTRTIQRCVKQLCVKGFLTVRRRRAKPSTVIVDCGRGDHE